ncbi:MAG: major outer membrane protein, partial [Campylobacteraceae bacterium]
MKLVKLSLAAIVAVGAMTTIASAQPLEEAIKNVEVSGFARYRFYSESDVDVGDGGHERNRFTGELNIESKITDNIKFGITLASENDNYAANDASSSGGIDVDKFWFQYAVEDFSVKAGKFEVPTPWTDPGDGGSRGNGALALYTGLENWTFAGAYYTQVNGFDQLDAVITYDGEDVMALAAIGAYENFGFQVWGARMTNIFDYAVFGQVDVNFNGFTAMAQANYLRLEDNAKTLLGSSDKSGIFMVFDVGYASDFFYVTGVYVKTDKVLPFYSLATDNDGFIQFGQQLYTIYTNEADAKTFYLYGGLTYNKYGAEI